MEENMTLTTCGNCGDEFGRKTAHLTVDKMLDNDWFCEGCRR